MFQMTRVIGSGAKAHTERLLLGVYVDDLAVAYKESGEGSLYHDFTLALRRWQVEDEGELRMISSASSLAPKVTCTSSRRLTFSRWSSNISPMGSLAPIFFLLG